MTKRDAYLNWLHSGVKHGVITEKKAKFLYEEQYAKLSVSAFLKLLYNM